MSLFSKKNSKKREEEQPIINFTEIDARTLVVPKDSLVVLHFKDLSLNDEEEARTIGNIMNVLKNVGEERNIRFVYLPDGELTVIKASEIGLDEKEK
jgi:hypothetical protein